MRVREWLKKRFGIEPSAVPTKEDCIQRYKADNEWFDSLPEGKRKAFEKQYLIDSFLRAQVSEARANEEFNNLLQARKRTAAH
jgi:hypothetical protein